MQCCVTLQKNILPNILSFFYIFGIKFCLKFSGDSGIKRGGGGVWVKPTIIFSHRRKTSSFYAVLFHMHLQITRPFSGVVALLAGKRFLAGVWKHVILHTTVVTARIVALFTSKGLFSSVSELVSLQILRLSGGIVTLLTTEMLLSWMGSHANQKILFCSNQGSPSFSKLSKSADILKFCPAPPRRKKTLPLHPGYAL